MLQNHKAKNCLQNLCMVTDLFSVLLAPGGYFRIPFLQPRGTLLHRLLEPNLTASAAVKTAAWLLT